MKANGPTRMIWSDIACINRKSTCCCCLLYFISITIASLLFDTVFFFHLFLIFTFVSSDIIEEYKKEMQKLARRLTWLMLGSLGIAKKDLKWAGSTGESKKGSAALQLNYYPACPDPDQAMGLAAHTDSTLLTILYQSNTSGLQVLKEGIGWITVPPIPGGLVVNVGDLLHILSNGLYPSVLHRAVVNRTKHRLSIAFLYGPPSSVEISPLQKLVGPNHPPLYRPVTWNEYLGTKAKYFNKALSSVRICAPLNGLADVNDHNRVRVG